MARVGIPRLRHLKHRDYDRVRRQPNTTNFVEGRASSLLQYPSASAVWDGIKATNAEAVAGEVTDL